MSAQEERLAAADRLAEVLARVTATASHPSGLVTVTASAVGALESVRIRPAALGHGPDAVGRLVAETARLATDAAVQTGYNELAKTLGDGMAMAFEDFAGPPPLHRQEPPAGASAGAPGGTSTRSAPHGGAHARPGAFGDAPPRPDGFGGAPARPGAFGAGPARSPAAGGRPAQRPPFGAPPAQPPATGAAFPHHPAPGSAPAHRPPPGPQEPPAASRPWSAQPAKPAQRPRPPADDDEDDFFADPFRGQRR